MSCSSCGSGGTCGCSSVEIPIGPPGEDGVDGASVSVIPELPGANCINGGIKITDGAGNVSYVCNGAPGVDGTSGTTTTKYANTFVVVSNSNVVLRSNGTQEIIFGFTPISISKASIISCNPLINTCVSTPEDFDFVIEIWKQNGSQWVNVTQNTSFISAIIYDTAGSILTITPAAAGTYRVVIIG